jgi:hypothetical protein
VTILDILRKANRGPDSEVLEGEWRGLGDFLDLTVPNARRADLQPFAGTLDEGANGLKIDVPAAFGDIMSVADTVAELRPATAYIANLCHKTKIS